MDGQQTLVQWSKVIQPSPLRVDQQYIVELKSDESELARHVSGSDDVDGIGYIN
jgi:hypothetical protein